MVGRTALVPRPHRPEERREHVGPPVHATGAAGRRRRTEQDVSRLQGFSDAVFALSATLLVVTIGDVPGSYEELLEAVARFPAFALAFAALVSLWVNHRQFFAAYPLADGWTIVLNSALLLVVLLYVYPLKLLAEVLSERFLGAAPEVTAAMGDAETRGLFLVFGAAVVAVTLILTLMHARAWQLREELGLDALGCYELSAEILVYAAIATVAALSMLVAFFGLGLGWGLPFWVYGLSPLAVAAERLLTRGRRRQLAAAGPRAGAPQSSTNSTRAMPNSTVTRPSSTGSRGSSSS